MATFFSLQNGSLSASSTYALSLSTAEVLSLSTGVWLGTTDAYSPIFTGNGSNISAIAVNLSARTANPGNSTLTLKISSASSTITENYAVSSFTSFDGSNNFISPYSQNWQLLKLTSPYSLANLAPARISLATSSTNTLALMCSSTNNNYHKMVLVSNSLIPNINDNIHIGSSLEGSSINQYVVTAATSSYRNLYIHNGGILTFPSSPNVTLSINGSAGLQITSNGTLNVGTSSSVVPLSTTHTIILSNTQIDVHNGGTFNVYGYPELTTTNLVSTHPIGSRIFTTTNNVSSDWRVGDIIAFKPNLSARTSFDNLILSSFLAPNVFTTTSSSLCTHTGSADSFAFIPDIYNLSRNVIIQGLSSTNRGVIRTIGASNTNINYATLTNLGYNSLAYDTGLEIYHNLSGNFNLSGSVIYNNTAKLFNTSRVAARLFTSASTYLRGISSIGTLGTGDFTAEAWIYPTSRAALTYVLDLNDTGVSTVRPTIYIDNSGLVRYRAENPTDLITSTVAVPLSTWTHVAVSKISGSTKLFINGVQSGPTYTDSKNYATGKPIIGLASDIAWPFLGYISTLRVSFEGLYNNSFSPTWNLPNLSSTKFLIFSNPLERTIIDNSALAIPLSNIGGIAPSVFTRGTNNLFNLVNTKINNNILSGTNFSLTNTSITGSTLEIKDNSILSTVLTGGVIINTVSGSINMSNNRTIGALGHGIHLFNNTLTGTYGALNYNSALQGMMVSGTNTGTIIGGSINSARDGVYVDASADNLSGLTFQNIITNNNTIDGFTVSGNNLNYLTPVTLNINGLTANNNSGYGLEAYNITGNISSSTLNNNISGGVRTSIGNGPTIFDGLTSILSGNCFNILTAFNYGQTAIKNALLSSSSLTGIALNINVNKLEEFRLENSTLSANKPLNITYTRPKLEGSYIFHNSNSNAYGLSSLALTGYQTDGYKEGIIVMRENGLSGNHYKYIGAGSISLDTVEINTPNTVSERLTPWSSITKLRSTSKLIPINLGESLTVSVLLKRSTGYTGSAPRLMLVGNAILGYYDSVLTTSTQISGWEDLYYTLPTALDTGVVELYVDCSGNVGSGYINIDSWNFY